MYQDRYALFNFETMELNLIGRKIVNIRKMTKKEKQVEYWEDHNHPIYVIVLDGGIKLYPSMDYEGNGGGALFGSTKDNKTFAI